jgi:PBSX family phage terminase large subunit
VSAPTPAPAPAAAPDLTPSRRPYRPYGSACAVLYGRGPELVMSGSAGTGKSRACLEKLHLVAEKYPGSRTLIVRKTRSSLTESGLVTFEEKVVPAGHPVLAGPQRRNRQAYHYPNGSEIVVGGLDKPAKVMSTEFDIIYVQEAIELTEHDWESLSSRLRNGVLPYQQMIGDTNPDAPTHWLMRRSERGATELVECRHEDNPVLWDHARGDWTPLGVTYIARLDALTGVRLHRLRYGRWVAAEGIVYDGWDRAVHLIDRFEVPANWRRIRVVDFGYTNPFVCQWWAVDPDGRMYLYREIYCTGRIVADHARQILALSAGERIEATITDHDAEDRATLEAAGIHTTAAWKAVTPGIQAVQDRLRVAGDGRPRLCLLRDSLVERDDALEAAKKPWCTEQEFDGYVWPKGQDGKPVKEEPVKLNDHGMDCARYSVAYVDELGGAGEATWAPDPFADVRF